MPLVELLAGNVNAIGSIDGALPAFAVPRTQRATPRVLDWDAIESQLQELAQRTPPISVTEAAQIVGVEKRTLVTRLGAIVSDISGRHARHAASQAEQSAAWKAALVEDAVRGLVGQGLAPNRRNMAEALEGKLAFAGTTVWEAWRSARADLEGVDVELDSVCTEKTSENAMYFGEKRTALSREIHRKNNHKVAESAEPVISTS